MQPAPRSMGNCTRFTASFISHSARNNRRPWRLATCCRNCAESPHARGRCRMLQALRTEVLEANLELVRRGLVLFTFGNASGISREDGLVVIKPSGVPYEKLKPDDIVITDLEGRVVEGTLRPSSDLLTHLVLYRAFPSIGGIAHTHSRHATAWAQACREIPCLGTTHADYFHGPVPVTKALSSKEVRSHYARNSGR